MKKATRESYGEALKALRDGGAKDLVVLDADLAGATKTGTFQKAYPESHFNCGIQEANMLGVAGGLSTMGLVPFASTFAMFAAGRAYEQIRNTIGYPALNVKIGATHGGISVGEDGASHQCLEDFALMRTIPGMTVICPSDDVEAKAAVRAAYEHKGPVYLRFSRLATECYHKADYRFTIGKGEIVRKGKDAAIIATGIMVPEAIGAAEILAKKYDVAVINMPTIKPLDTELVLTVAKDCKRIITLEEHSVIGGLGEAVAAVLAENKPTPMLRLGVNDVFGHSGKAEKLLAEFGLTRLVLAIRLSRF